MRDTRYLLPDPTSALFLFMDHSPVGIPLIPQSGYSLSWTDILHPYSIMVIVRVLPPDKVCFVYLTQLTQEGKERYFISSGYIPLDP